APAEPVTTRGSAGASPSPPTQESNSDEIKAAEEQPVGNSDVDLLVDPQDTPPSGFVPFRENCATAIAEPPKQTSRTARRTSASAKKSGAIRVQPAYQRTAQPSLAKGRGFALSVVAAVLVAIALSVGGTWLLSGSSGPPQARYLPRDCDLVVSLKWSDLPPSGVASTRQKRPEKVPEELPGLMLVERCRLFLRNAGLRDEDVERVNAGRAADGSGMVVVYQLSRAVQAQVVADLHPFRSRRKSAGPLETIGGVPLYSLGPTVIAFPEPQVVINGETELVRQVLGRWSHGIAEPLRAYLQAADLSATSVVISARGPAPVLKDGLQVPSHLADMVRGTTASFRYGDQICLTRTFHLGDSRTGDELQTSLQSSLLAEAQDPKTPQSLRQVLTQTQVSASRGQVQIELTLPAAQLEGKSLEIVNRLF
ncbi:MAG: hypothetical protein NTY19_42640, partial [Planctomycetota bacterium]|nr:hypothetical protein [Planctomycetota bacterium]